MPASTGSTILDRMLDGGIPENRTVLATGGPGTGKSTLAMQFLQAGLDAGESGLFISTEQRPGELADSFAPFCFDLDDEELDVTTLHAAPGQTVESDETQLVLRTLEGENAFEGGFTAPYELSYVQQFLERYGDVDRVVLDSVTGLSLLSDDEEGFRRSILDLVRLFNEEFEATAMFTAGSDETRASDLLNYTAHGVISLRRDEHAGEDHHYIKVEKLRGVEHDKRTYRTQFHDGGIRPVTTANTGPNPFGSRPTFATGIPGLDRLTGGGLVRGGLNLIQTDGRAHISPFIVSIARQAIEEGAVLGVTPTADLGFDRLRTLLDRHVGDVDALLDDDRLIVLDMMTEGYPGHANHLLFQSRDETLRETFEEVYRRVGDRPYVTVDPIEPFIQATSPDTLREARYWAHANLQKDEDVVLYQVNPETTTATLASFYRDTAQLVLECYVDEHGTQAVRLLKGTDGAIGSERAVEFVDETPHVRVEDRNAE